MTLSTEHYAPACVDAVYQQLEAIKKASGKAKIDALQATPEHAMPLMKWLLVATYDPMTTYGIKKHPKGVAEPNGEGEFWIVPKLLAELSARKLTGLAAADSYAGVMASQSYEGRYLLIKIIDRDLKIGMNISSINKAFPGLITKFSPMLAHKYEAKRIKSWPVGVEIKLDGVRVLAVVKMPPDGPVTVDFLSRSGKAFTSFGQDIEFQLTELAIAAAEQFNQRCTTCEGVGTIDEKMGGTGSHLRSDAPCPDCGGLEYTTLLSEETNTIVIDGEVVTGSFNDTVSAVRKKGEEAKDAVFHVFNLLSLDEFENGSEADNTTHYGLLRELFIDVDSTRARPLDKVQLSKRYIAGSDEEVQSIAAAVMARGLEGVIVKPFDGCYEPKRSYHWLKVKAEESEDLKIIGAFEGEAGTKYEGQLGGVIVDHEGVEVRVGGGWSDAQRVELWADYQADIKDTQIPGVAMRLLGRIIEVEYHEVTPDGSLRHPRFKRFRDTAHPGHKE